MRRALLLSILTLPVLARLPAFAQEGEAFPAASDAAVTRLAERLARLEEDGLDPRHYGMPAASRSEVLRGAQAALTDLLLGRGMRALEERYPDVYPGPDRELYETLFPPVTADLLTYYLDW